MSVNGSYGYLLNSPQDFQLKRLSQGRGSRCCVFREDSGILNVPLPLRSIKGAQKVAGERERLVSEMTTME